VTKIVITAAGKGTRLLPFTKEMPKEMMPIFSHLFTNKKVVLPLLQYVYEQLYSMNFRDYCFVLVLIILVAMLTFTALNSGTIDLDLAFFAGTYPISVVLVATFVVGTIFGMLCLTAFVFRLVKERRTLRQSLRTSESEVSSLRNLPLSDAD